MRKIAVAALLLLPLIGAGAQVHKAQQYVNAAKGKAPLGTAAWGVLAVNGKGETLASLNPQQQLAPASNMK